MAARMSLLSARSGGEARKWVLDATARPLVERGVNHGSADLHVLLLLLLRARDELLRRWFARVPIGGTNILI